ncbi:hypothetical protein [Sphingopyxis sp. SCN 67-31]|uniref:hypothetical protein n=1 Tax=Sphingopyxis sp. SCN 67-31 TaxID=1660142 RepID=UPI000869C1E1|nr:hypothetical protein [Sphingopyxis sp. SCN 67-31]ODU19725.1 MAG: hypothetical protein ABS88_24145 [Sphingopyxis sp. SCN 67-31]
MPLLILSLLALQSVSAASPAQPTAEIAAAIRDEQDIDQIRAAIVSGRLDEAAALIGIFDAAHPGSQPASLVLAKGELALEEGSAAKADELTRAVPASGPARCSVERIRALAMAERGQTDAAIDSLAGVTEHCTADWRIWRALGTLLAQKGQMDASRFAFTQAMQGSPSPALIRNDQARALIRAGDIDAAAQVLRVADGTPAPDRETIRLQDFLAGMRGLEPARAAADSDEMWAQRLVDAAQGARRADHPSLAQALMSEALLVSPRYDPRLLAEAQIP